MNVLGSIGKQTGESVESVLKKEEEKRKKGYGGKDVWKRKVLSLEWKSEGVMDDEWWVDRRVYARLLVLSNRPACR